MRSKIFDEILKKVNSPEYKERKRKEYTNYLNSASIDRQLGYFIGEYIVTHYLPTLSTDLLQTRNVIKVNEEDEKENKRLDNDWTSTLNLGSGRGGDNEKWELYRKHNKMLESKYLPEVLKCWLPLTRITNIDEFKEGLIDSLWNCDLCSYNLDKNNIKIENDLEMGNTTISFLRDVDIKK